MYRRPRRQPPVSPEMVAKALARVRAKIEARKAGREPPPAAEIKRNRWGPGKTGIERSAPQE